jgi:hypothetical protein
MNRNAVPDLRGSLTSLLHKQKLTCLLLVLCFTRATIGQAQTETPSSPTGTVMHVTHLLGFDDARHNANGELTIQRDILQFRRDGSPSAQMSIGSIQNVHLESTDKQVGGTPMMLGKAAVPFEGGRVVSLFSHMTYDILTVEYVDNSGGFHGAIFQMNKGQGQIFENALLASGAHISPQEGQASTQNTPEVKNETK